MVLECCPHTRCCKFSPIYSSPRLTEFHTNPQIRNSVTFDPTTRFYDFRQAEPKASRPSTTTLNPPVDVTRPYCPLSSRGIQEITLTPRIACPQRVYKVCLLSLICRGRVSACACTPASRWPNPAIPSHRPSRLHAIIRLRRTLAWFRGVTTQGTNPVVLCAPRSHLTLFPQPGPYLRYDSLVVNSLRWTVDLL